MIKNAEAQDIFYLGDKFIFLLEININSRGYGSHNQFTLIDGILYILKIEFN